MGKPSFKDTALLFGGTTVGAVTSNVVVGAINKPKAAEDDIEAQKKEKNKLMLTQGTVAVASLAGMFFLKIKNPTANMGVKGVLLGMAMNQGLGFAKTLAKGNPTVTKNSVVADALGLGCTCNSGASLNAITPSREWILPATNDVAVQREVVPMDKHSQLAEIIRRAS